MDRRRDFGICPASKRPVEWCHERDKPVFGETRCTAAILSAATLMQNASRLTMVRGAPPPCLVISRNLDGQCEPLHLTSSRRTARFQAVHTSEPTLQFKG